MAQRAAAWAPFAAYGVGLGVVMALFAYGDLQESSFVANVMAHGHWDLYRYFQAVPDLRSVPTAMPPLYYASTAVWLWLLHLIHLDPVPTAVSLMYRQVMGRTGGWPVMFGLVLLKLPNAAALALGAWAFARLGPKLGVTPRRARWLWLLCPILLAESFMQGQFDIIPAAATAWALLVYDEERPWRTFLLLGVAAAFKNYALLFIVPTALLVSHQHLRRAVAYAAVGAAPFVVSYLPWAGPAVLHRVFLARDGGTILHTVTLGIVPIHLWLLVYLGICAVAWVQGSRRAAGLKELAVLWMVVTASILMLSWWLPQWIVWMVPMATVFAAVSRPFWWTWVAVNGLVLLNNLIEWPHNLDGHMLSLILGHGVSFTYRALVGGHGLALVFTALIVGFGALVYQAWVSQERPYAGGAVPWWCYPLPLLAYVSAMALQHL